jgi:hypothetical protein
VNPQDGWISPRKVVNAAERQKELLEAEGHQILFKGRSHSSRTTEVIWQTYEARQEELFEKEGG